jgi:hypothetical protein
MRRLIFLIVTAVTVTIACPAFAQTKGAALQSADGNAISASNPLPVTFGTGDQTIAGDLSVGGDIDANTVRSTNGDEKIYGTTSAIDLNLYGTYSTAILGGVATGTGFTVTAGVAKLVVDGSTYSRGNIGIGISAPVYKLAVDGTVYLRKASLSTAVAGGSRLGLNLDGSIYTY